MVAPGVRAGLLGAGSSATTSQSYAPSRGATPVGASTNLDSMVVDEDRAAQPAEDRVLPPDPAPLARQTLAYGLTGLIGPLVGMITLPIFARVFTRGEYGLMELGTTVMAVALALTDAGLCSAALRSYYDYGSDEEGERRSVMLTGSWQRRCWRSLSPSRSSCCGRTSPVGCSGGPGRGGW